MKTIGILTFAAALILVGAASAHPHFMPSHQTGAGADHMGGGDDNSSKWSKTGDDNKALSHHEVRKDDRRERVAHRLEERRERLKMEIAKLVLELTRGVGKPERIKLEIVRLEHEIAKVNNELLKGEAAA